MPQVGKQALGQFIRTNCLRQLALNLYPDNQTFRPDRQDSRDAVPSISASRACARSSERERNGRKRSLMT